MPLFGLPGSRKPNDCRLRAAARSRASEGVESGRSASFDDFKRLADNVHPRQLFFGKGPIGFQNQVNGLPKIRPGFFKSGTLSVCPRQFLDEANIPFGYFAENCGKLDPFLHVNRFQSVLEVYHVNLTLQGLSARSDLQSQTTPNHTTSSYCAQDALSVQRSFPAMFRPAVEYQSDQATCLLLGRGEPPQWQMALWTPMQGRFALFSRVCKPIEATPPLPRRPKPATLKPALPGCINRSLPIQREQIGLP